MTPAAAAFEIDLRLDRIEVENARLQCFISLDREGARATARAVEERRAAGRHLGPLDGKHVAIKDNIAVAGLPRTAGVAGWQDRIAEQDAGVTARLRNAGAIVVGTTNLHEGALGATTDNPTFGRCANALAPDHTPGGSSGGSAAAVAAGLVDLALGTDTMGSVRIPAAYCGIAGIKPTAGLVGRSGLAYLSPTLDTIGPIAPNVEHLWPALLAISGPDAGDPDSRIAPPEWREPPNAATLRGLRVGIPRQIADVDCERVVRDAFRRSCNIAKDSGARLIDVDVLGWVPGCARRGGLLLAEAEGAVQFDDLIDEGSSLSAGFRNLLLYGRAARSAQMVDALARIRAAGAACHRALADVDMLLMPTAPQRAFRHADPAPANQADFTALANFSGCPSVAFPVYIKGETLPASVQLVSQPWTEAHLLAWAGFLARRVGVTNM